jgi:hypothetical protein
MTFFNRFLIAFSCADAGQIGNLIFSFFVVEFIALAQKRRSFVERVD